MPIQQLCSVHLQHEVRPVLVRSSAQQPEQALPLHPEKDPPVEMLVPLARRHPYEAFLQRLLLHRLVIADEGYAVLRVLYAHDLRPAGGLDGEPLFPLDLEPVEERARAQEPMPPDTLPAFVLRHMVERGVPGDEPLEVQPLAVL